MSEIKKVRTLTIGGKTYQLGGDGEGGDSYVLPTASEQELGGIKAAAKGENDTIEVKIGDDGKLYVEAVGGGSGEGGLTEIPIASSNTIGGIKAIQEEREGWSREVLMDSNSFLYIKEEQAQIFSAHRNFQNENDFENSMLSFEEVGELSNEIANINSFNLENDFLPSFELDLDRTTPEKEYYKFKEDSIFFKAFGNLSQEKEWWNSISFLERFWFIINLKNEDENGNEIYEDLKKTHYVRGVFIVNNPSAEMNFKVRRFLNVEAIQNMDYLMESPNTMSDFMELMEGDGKLLLMGEEREFLIEFHVDLNQDEFFFKLKLKPNLLKLQERIEQLEASLQ